MLESLSESELEDELSEGLPLFLQRFLKARPKALFSIIKLTGSQAPEVSFSADFVTLPLDFLASVNFFDEISELS